MRRRPGLRLATTIIEILLALAIASPARAQATSVVVFSSAARSASPTNSATLETSARGVQLTLDVTAVSGTNPTLDVKLQQFDALSGQWTDVAGAVFQRITGVGQRTLTVFPAPESKGNLRSVTGTDPAANTEVSETVPGNTRWRLHSFTVRLVTDANVATRSAELVIDDGVNTLVRVGNTGTQAASLTRDYYLGQFGTAPTTLTNAIAWVGGAALDLPGGARIRTSTASLQATDNYGAPQYLVEEYIGNYAGTPIPRAWRAVATIGGTASPTFTFSIGGTYVW